MNWHVFPKVELHLHLDCSLSFQLVSRIKPSISESEFRKTFVAPANCCSLNEYIERALPAIELMQSRENLRLTVLDLFDQLKMDGVVYAEIRFAPLEHMRNGLNEIEVIETVHRAVLEAEEQTGVKSGIILCSLRYYQSPQSLKVAQLVNDFKGSRVVGFDLAGDELLPLKPHIKAFEYALENNIFRTIHAGEARGAESVAEVLTTCSPHRIGHGVRAVEDPSLLAKIQNQNVHLEVCPSSNLKTGVFKTMKAHSVQNLLDHDISLGINTDGRTISDVSLTDEYQILIRQFSWNADHFRKCNIEAMNHAFADEELKDEIRKLL